MMARLMKPWMMLYRRRLLLALAFAALITSVMHMWVSASGLTNVGVFWHSFCGCPPEPDDLRVLLNFPIVAGFVGFVLGIGASTPGALPEGGLTAPGAIAAQTNLAFLLTRPLRRSTLLFAPLAVALMAVAIIPLLTDFLLLAWLRLVQAPSLGHLLAIVQQAPKVAVLGPHPGFPDILLALDMPRRWAASVVLGLCAYVLVDSQRWLLLSPHKRFKLLGLVPIVVLFVPLSKLLGGRWSRAILMSGSSGSGGLYLPGTENIALHLLLAAAVVLGCWRLLRTVEL